MVFLAQTTTTDYVRADFMEESITEAWQRQRIQNTQEIKRTLFNKTKQDKRQSCHCKDFSGDIYYDVEDTDFIER